MKYFNYLDINFQPAATRLKEYLIKENLVADIKSAWRLLDLQKVTKEIPEIVTLFEPLGLEVDLIAIFVTYYKVGAIHIDGDVRSCRINFPIMNCNDTVTNFFKIKNFSSSEKQQNNGFKLHMFDPKDCELVDQMFLTRAAVMRVLEPHQVVSMHNSLPRVSCTVGFKQDISHLLTL